MKKKAIVSGGTSGIGLNLVKKLVQENYFVYFIGSSNKGQRIQYELNINENVCEFIQLDLSNIKSVYNFTEKFNTENSQLDILINVAGVMLPERNETSEGIEKTFAIGYLSAYILSTKLIPVLSKAINPIILNISGKPSMVLKRKLNFSDFNYEKYYNGINVALDTIHAKLVLTQILAEKFNTINVNAFYSGGVKSDLGRNLKFPYKQVFKFMNLFYSKVDKTSIYAITSSYNKGITGQLFLKKQKQKIKFSKKYKDLLLKKNRTSYI